MLNTLGLGLTVTKDSPISRIWIGVYILEDISAGNIQTLKMYVPVDPEIQQADSNPKEALGKTYKQSCPLYTIYKEFQPRNCLHMGNS